MARHRIAVCDDEPSELEDIVQIVRRYDVHGDFDIENYTDGAMLLVEVLAMLLIGLQVSDTDALMQAGSARLIYVVFSNLIQIPLLILQRMCQMMRVAYSHSCRLLFSTP